MTDFHPNETAEDVAIRYNVPLANPFDLFIRAKSGLPTSVFYDLLNLTGLTQPELASLLDVSAKTINRYHQEGKKLNALNSEQALKMIRLYQKGVEVFGSLGSFNSWLRKPSFGLGEELPLHFMETSGGIDLIYDELTSIEFGSLA